MNGVDTSGPDTGPIPIDRSAAPPPAPVPTPPLTVSSPYPVRPGELVVRRVQQLHPWATWEAFQDHIVEDMHLELRVALQAEGLVQHGNVRLVSHWPAASAEGGGQVAVVLSCIAKLAPPIDPTEETP